MKILIRYISAIFLSFAALSTTSYAYGQSFYNVAVGWNMLGNGGSTTIDVATVFNDVSKYTTVWKWNKTTSKWALYAPSLSSEMLIAYTQAKDFDVLTTIEPKEGFWVNSTSSAMIAGPIIMPPDEGMLPETITLQEKDIGFGWNLMASNDNKLPSQLNAELMSSLAAVGKSIKTIWSWDVAVNNWKFYASELDAQGGSVLTDYIVSKNYRSFASALTNTDGFWINVGQPNIKYGHFYVQYAYSGTSAVAYLATFNDNDLAEDSAFDWSKDIDITNNVVVTGEVGGDSTVVIGLGAIFKDKLITLNVKGYVYPWMGVGFRYQCLGDLCEIKSGIKTSEVTDIIWSVE